MESRSAGVAASAARVAGPAREPATRDDEGLTMMSIDYRGKVVIVTGVGRPGQIGHATALAFGRAGAQLVLCDVNATGVAARAKEFQALGLEAQPAAGDLTEPDIARLAVETAIRCYGRLDALINIAGGLTTYGPIAEMTVKAFDREI